METLRLLKRSPETALLLLANKKHGISLSPDNSRVVSIEPAAGKRAIAVIQAYTNTKDEFRDPGLNEPYSGSFRFPFDRLDLADIFGDTVDTPLTSPSNTEAVLDILTKESKIVFDNHDFEFVRLEGTEAQLVASAHSRRWVGSITIRLK